MTKYMYSREELVTEADAMIQAVEEGEDPFTCLKDLVRIIKQPLSHAAQGRRRRVTPKST